MSKLEFDSKKISVVNIEEVNPNDYNPKEKGTEQYKRVLKSIRLNGLRLPIVVREVEDGYEIIDGEQRFTACRELNFEKIIIYNEGKISDKRAKELTIWYEQGVPFDELQLAELISSMMDDFDDIQLPFSDNEVSEMQALTKFSWDEYDSSGGLETNKDQESKKEEDEITTLSLAMTKKQYDIVMEALDKKRSDNDSELTDQRCLELICADYLGT